MFNHAEKAAKSSFYDKVRIGIAAKIGKTIITEYNRPQTHPLQRQYDSHIRDMPYLHAEIALLAKLRGVPIKEVWLYREDRNGNLAMCRPCKGCMMALKAFGVKTIHYTTPDGYATEKI